ncbi:MAG: hypothetical protein PUG15_00155 [Bacteroidales bacterium]|nr:hypothetical protein [Bacteroidales bacterium]
MPSGLKWAACNVGAANPWDYGDYFAWGETVGYGKSDLSNAHNYAYSNTYVKTYYAWNTYKWCNGTTENTLTKYNINNYYGSVVDNKTVLNLEDDAARANMGSFWRMPTWDEQQELLNNCYWEWTDDYNGKGVKGYVVYKVKNTSDKGEKKYKGKTVTLVGSYSLADAHIFLPAAGGLNENEFHNIGSDGLYWSSLLNEGSPNHVYYMRLNSDYVDRYDSGRYEGHSVRAVVE